MVRQLVVVLATLVLPSSLLPVVLVQAQETCTLCFDGSDANLSKTVGGSDGVPCSALVSDVALDSDSCRDLQLLGYRYCDCPTYPQDDFCPMCQDAFVNIPNLWKKIPGTDNSCDDRLFVRASSVESCEDARKPGYVCGCPGAEEPPCKVCNGDDDDVEITEPDAVLTVDGVGVFTCQEFAAQALLGSLSMDQCGSVQNAAMNACGCPTDGDSSSSGTTPEDSSNIDTDTPAATETGSGSGTDTNEGGSATPPDNTEQPVASDANQASSENTNTNSAAFSNSCRQGSVIVMGLFVVLTQWML